VAGPLGMRRREKPARGGLRRGLFHRSTCLLRERRRGGRVKRRVTPAEPGWSVARLGSWFACRSPFAAIDRRGAPRRSVGTVLSAERTWIRFGLRDDFVIIECDIENNGNFCQLCFPRRDLFISARFPGPSGPIVWPNRCRNSRAWARVGQLRTQLERSRAYGGRTRTLSTGLRSPCVSERNSVPGRWEGRPPF